MPTSSKSSKPQRSFLDIEGYGRMEVKPGSETFVQAVLQRYGSVNSSVKIERAPNYIGNSSYEDTPNAKRKK